MEKLKVSKITFPAMQILKALATLGLALSLTACPGGGNDGGGGGKQVVTPLDPFGGNCATCASNIANPVTLSVFESSNVDGNVVFSNMEIMGDASYVIPNASGNNFRNYEGPIAVRGTMTVRNAVTDQWGSGCALPAGTYNVQTYEVGSMGYAGGDINVPRLRTNSGSVEIVIANGILSHRGARLTGAIGVSRVGGKTCSDSFMDAFY